MAHFVAAEQYGYPLSDSSPDATAARSTKHCRFRKAACNKKGGVCSITDGKSFPITCPERFKEADAIYSKTGEIALGQTNDLVALSEIPFLESHDESGAAPGRIDNVLVHFVDEQIKDWCALEVQAVYFSGASMERELHLFGTIKRVPDPAKPLLDDSNKPEVRRPDFRSSAPKRLLPQLEIKVPTLRRWGKKMCVVVDQPFFDWMPEMQPVNHVSNADIIWIVFALDTQSTPYKLTHHQTFYATLEESREGLIAATVPSKPSVEGKMLDIITKGLAGKTAEQKKIQWHLP